MQSLADLAMATVIDVRSAENTDPTKQKKQVSRDNGCRQTDRAIAICKKTVLDTFFIFQILIHSRIRLWLVLQRFLKGAFQGVPP